MTKTARQAEIELLKIMEGFTSILEATQNIDITLSATISNVNLFDLLDLYKKMSRKKVRLAVPGEFYNDGKYILVYAITTGVNVYIESEMVLTATSKIKPINYN